MAVEQPGEVVYFILDGAVKIHVEQMNGSDVILAVLGPGETVGEMTLMDRDGRSANVVTLQESTLLWMAYSDFQTSLDRMPEIRDNLMHTLSGRLRRANERMQWLATQNVAGRVACQILALATRYGLDDSAGNVFIPLRLTQGDIGSLTGASRERVNQVISIYKRLGHISVDSDYRITVCNREELARCCGGPLP